MHKVITLLSAVALSFGAFAEIVSMPLVKGENRVEHPAKVIAVKAASATASGTLVIREILEVASESVASVAVTNIVAKDIVTVTKSAYVNQSRVHSGTDTEWNRWNETVTNIAGSVTNVYTLSLAQWHDGSVTNSLVYTNSFCYIETAESVRPGIVTNIVSHSVSTWTNVPYTNDLYSGAASGGVLSAATNLVILGGRLDVSGTAVTNGNAYIIMEK